MEGSKFPMAHFYLVCVLAVLMGWVLENHVV